ncbi:MAG TPA: hypothetical protein VLF63_00895 [Patescibacteria group bacterium]|nr:hypothetical protein [Patescibacteria group bacterium]
MLNIRNINPMARAIGTMGAVAALVGGVTFAALTSNTVALGPNDVTTGTAHLQIAADTGTCANETFSDGPVAGFGTVSGLTSSSTSPTVNFCLKNTGDVALNIEGLIDSNTATVTAGGYLNLNVSCNTIGTKADVLNTWYAVGEQFTSSSLAAGAIDTCTASLNLLNTYPGSGGETVPTFNVEFVGHQV